LQIHAAEAPLPTQRNRSQAGDRYVYKDGFERYNKDARRLLATISVRASAPLRTVAAVNRIVISMQRRFPAYTLDADDLAVAPLAKAPLQPAAEAVEAARAQHDPLRLRAQLGWFGLTVESLL
jgi:hypothetical protein